MCGIVALYDQQQAPPGLAVERALAAMAHRGPDGQGIWAPPDEPCALGHRRLAVIDLEGGGQPLRSGPYRLVANGEFYDYERTLDWLGGRGHRPATGSDSEVALLLYRELGVECFRLLRGEFAFALWDGVARRLLLVRDRFGIKPLFYAHQQGRLWAASEIKGLFAAGWPCAWDPEGVSRACTSACTRTARFFGGCVNCRPDTIYWPTVRGCGLCATGIKTTLGHGRFRRRRHWRRSRGPGTRRCGCALELMFRWPAT